MVGKVIDGRYLGSTVHKHPECKALYIQTPNGQKILLSKRNVMAMEDISNQYPDSNGITIMVIWENYESSLLCITLASAQARESQVIKPSAAPKSADTKTTRAVHKEMPGKSPKAADAETTRAVHKEMPGKSPKAADTKTTRAVHKEMPGKSPKEVNKAEYSAKEQTPERKRRPDGMPAAAHKDEDAASQKKYPSAKSAVTDSEESPIRRKVLSTNPAVSEDTADSKKKLTRILIVVFLVLLAATAIIAGYLLILKKHDHKWAPAECEVPEKCSICGATRGEPLGHIPGVLENNKVSCARCGEVYTPDVQSVPAATTPSGEKTTDSAAPEAETLTVVTSPDNILVDKSGNRVKASEFADYFGSYLSYIFEQSVQEEIRLVKADGYTDDFYRLENKAGNSNTTMVFSDKGSPVSESDVFDQIIMVGTFADPDEASYYAITTAVLIRSVDTTIGDFNKCLSITVDMMEKITQDGDKEECTINGIKYVCSGKMDANNSLMLTFTVNLQP